MTVADDDRARAFADLMVKNDVPFTASEDLEGAMNQTVTIRGPRMDQPRTIADLLADHPDFRQATFAMIKSHIAAGPRAAIVINRILNDEFVIAAMMKTVLSLPQIEWLYRAHKGRPYYNDLVQSVSGPVIPMALLGPEPVTKWRALLGATNSAEAVDGTLRRAYGSHTLIADNVAHGSDSEQAARDELAYFFPSEIRLWRGT